MRTEAPAIVLPFARLLAIASSGCDRRQTDGHSATPPAQGAATEAPAEAPADQSIQPAQQPPSEPASDAQSADAAADDTRPPESQ